MSRTIRRTKFNRKKHIFEHYWEEFSEKDVEKNRYIDVWKYHSDNYYTKKCKNTKQFLKTRNYKKLRQDFRIKALTQLAVLDDIVLSNNKARSIKWDLH